MRTAVLVAFLTALATGAHAQPSAETQLRMQIDEAGKALAKRGYELLTGMQVGQIKDDGVMGIDIHLRAAAVPPTLEIDPMFFADDAMTVPPPTPAQAERSAWIELVESLRQDIERLKAEREQPAAPPAPVEEAPQLVAANPVSAVRRRPAAAVVQMPTPPARAPRPNPRRPVQDQWGLFDPEQCGFAALLAKLDEIGTRDEVSA